MSSEGAIFTGCAIAGLVLFLYIKELRKDNYWHHKRIREMEDLMRSHNLEIATKRRELEIEERKFNKKVAHFEDYVALQNENLKNLKEEIEKEQGDREAVLLALKESLLTGRKWLAKMIGDAYSKWDNSDWHLQFKHAPKSAEVVKAIKEKNKSLVEKNAFLESQLAAYKEYFPFLDELEEDILEEKEDFRGMTKEDFGNIDPVRKLLSREEWESLSSVDRNQLAMDRYLQKTNKLQIGKMYERYIGWLFEKEGKLVEYVGLRDGLEDHGRDLLVSDPCSNKVTVVQAKCWSTKKTIHEKHIFQLFGSIYELAIANPDNKYFGLFVTTTELSPFAKVVAKKLGIVVAHRPLDKTFPMIKCNISKSGERIYHLPFDQQYDKTKISSHGEFMARTVKEAEEKGFRRAHRHSLNK